MAFHLVVWVVLERGGRVLLARRSPGRYGAGLWGLPGGHVEAGETLARAGAREVREEVGVRVEVGALAPLGVTRYVTPEAEGVDFFFRARSFEGEPAPIAECDAVAWHAPDALPTEVLPWLPRALELHLTAGVWLDESVDGASVGAP